MEKFINGFLEYKAEIPLYKKILNSYYPRIVNIVDFSEKNQWKILISEIKIHQGKFKSLDFKPPKYMKKFSQD